MNSNNSIFSCEAMAILQALLIIQRKGGYEWTIFTDSLSVIKNLASNGLDSKMSLFILKIREITFYLKTRNNIKIKFVWIPSHCGILGNEIVDEIANKATHKDQICIDYCWFSDIIPSFKIEQKDEMEKYIVDYHKGLKYVNLNKKFVLKPWFSHVRWNREIICLINRLKSYHNFTKHHLFNKNIIPEDTCECAEDVESHEHLLWNCKKYQESRKNLIEFIMNFNKEKFNFGEDIGYMVNKDPWGIGSQIAKFFIENNIKI